MSMAFGCDGTNIVIEPYRRFGIFDWSIKGWLCESYQQLQGQVKESPALVRVESIISSSTKVYQLEPPQQLKL